MKQSDKMLSCIQIPTEIYTGYQGLYKGIMAIWRNWNSFEGLEWTIWRDWDGLYEGIEVIWRGWDRIDGLWLYEGIETLLMDGDGRYEGIALELYEGIEIILLIFFIALMYFVLGWIFYSRGNVS